AVTKGQEDPREVELKRLLERINAFRSLVSGEAWTVIPPEAGKDDWGALAADNPYGSALRSQFARMLTAYRSGDRAAFDAAVDAVRAEGRTLSPELTPAMETRLKVELAYNRWHPFQIA